MAIPNYDVIEGNFEMNPKFTSEIEKLPKILHSFELRKNEYEKELIQKLRDLGEGFSNDKYCRRHYAEVQKILAKLSFPHLEDIIGANANSLFLPVARAGIPLVRGLPQRFSQAHYGLLNMKRDEETLETIGLDGNCTRKDLKRGIENIIILESMFATGGSGISAIEQTRKVHPNTPISLYAIFGAPEGVIRFEQYCKEKGIEDVSVYIGQLDDQLNDKGYIVPGIGDAGDMAYGKKGSKENPLPQNVLDFRRELVKMDYNPQKILEATLGINLKTS